MNKKQLIENVALKTRSSKAATENVLDAIIQEIKAQVRKGTNVKIVDFGTFTKLKRKARIGHNPQTGISIRIPSSFAPKFRAGKHFKEMVR